MITTNNLDQVMYLCSHFTSEPGALRKVLEALGPPYETFITHKSSRYHSGSVKLQIGYLNESFHIHICLGSPPRYLYGNVDKRTAEAGLKLLELVKAATHEELKYADNDKLKAYFAGKMGIEQTRNLLKLHELREGTV